MSTRSNRKQNRQKKKIMAWLALLISPVVLFFLLDFCFPLHLPQNETLYARVVVDREGRPLRAFPDPDGVWRYEVSLEEISPLYIEALLNYEDRRFWHHWGIDPVALVRAAIGNIRNQRIVSGGSTITMQVARLLHPHSRTLFGKLHQVFRALQLEWHFDKTQILTLYCNIAPFGGTTEGVQAASYTYLNKSALHLTHAEAALLAVLPQSPTRYRPDLAPERAQVARDKVLDRLAFYNLWSAETVEQAKLEPVIAYQNKRRPSAPLLAERLIRQSNERVIKTFIDYNLQSALEDYLRYFIETQPEGMSAAIMVVDNSLAEVRAYLGTADFGNRSRFGHVDMIRATRSPGSTLKPFVYGMAMDAGLIHSHSLLSDAPMRWQNYQPGNFGGGFQGPVNVTEALQRSLNIPAVEVLDHLGPEIFVDRLANAGLQLTVPSHRSNLSVILGGAGTSLEKLVMTYAAFGAQGMVKNLRYTESDPSFEPRYLMSAEASWIIYDILRGVPPPTQLRSISALAKPSQLAWKTGTSYGMRDAWAIGVNTQYTIGVWVGRPDNTAIHDNTGRESAGPLLHTVADYLSVRGSIPRPEKVEAVNICWPLGIAENRQADSFCHRKWDAWTIQGATPPTFPDRYRPFTSNPFSFWVDTQTHLRVNPSCFSHTYEQKLAALWPSAVEPWLPTPWKRKNQLPNLSKHCNAQEIEPVRIEKLTSKTIFRKANNEEIAPRIPLMAAGGDGRYHWYINGQYLHTSPPAMHVELKQTGQHQIVVVDDSGSLDSVTITVE